MRPFIAVLLLVLSGSAALGQNPYSRKFPPSSAPPQPPRHSTGPAPGWQLLTTDPEGGTVYVKGVSREVETAHAWVLQDFDIPLERSGAKCGSVVSNLKFYCGNRAKLFDINITVCYSGRDGHGEALQTTHLVSGVSSVLGVRFLEEIWSVTCGRPAPVPPKIYSAPPPPTSPRYIEEPYIDWYTRRNWGTTTWDTPTTNW